MAACMGHMISHVHQLWYLGTATAQTTTNVCFMAMTPPMDNSHACWHNSWIYLTSVELWDHYWTSFMYRPLSILYSQASIVIHNTRLLHALCKNVTIHLVTTMLATFKNVLFPGHSHLLTPGIDDPFCFFIKQKYSHAVVMSTCLC